MTDQETNQAPVDQPATVPPASLSVQDLVLAMQVIQNSTARGAIQANEMAVVGDLYNKLIAFLTSAGAIQPVQDTGTTEEN